MLEFLGGVDEASASSTLIQEYLLVDGLYHSIYSRNAGAVCSTAPEIPRPTLTIPTRQHAVVTITFPCTPVTVLGIHCKLWGSNPLALPLTPANPNCTPLAGL
jgi:hypothetical protein